MRLTSASKAAGCGGSCLGDMEAARDGGRKNTRSNQTGQRNAGSEREMGPSTLGSGHTLGLGTRAAAKSPVNREATRNALIL